MCFIAAISRSGQNFLSATGEDFKGDTSRMNVPRLSVTHTSTYLMIIATLVSMTNRSTVKLLGVCDVPPANTVRYTSLSVLTHEAKCWLTLPPPVWLSTLLAVTVSSHSWVHTWISGVKKTVTTRVGACRP